jgi:hypothetical protein
MAKRVYFAFHYQDVIDFRANVVRKHNALQGVEHAGYYDASIWEETKKRGELALKRMINAELENTSVTVVLIGSSTWARRWVRYEIMKSIKRGNKLIGIHINGIQDKHQQTKDLGPNPFDFLGYSFNEAGTRLTMHEYSNGAWHEYAEVDNSATYEVSNITATRRGKGFKLSQGCPVYKWNGDNGYENFSTWIE